jgi:cobalt/nickel transport protein
MRKLFFMLIVGLTFFLLSIPSYAHFQMLYNDNSVVKPGPLNLKIVFTHPFEAGHTMDMGKDENGEIYPPIAFGELHKGERKDLLNVLKPITFTSLTNSGKAYEAEVRLRGMGDHVFYFVPAPYYEARKNFYIQQCTKTIFNVAGAPSDWHVPVGEPLPVEIVPLVTPYALWNGNAFRGVVTCGGKPVPGAKVRIEYMNHDIDGNAFVKAGKISAPHNALLAQFVRADENGVFIYAIPRAGWWGFAALGAGGKGLSYNGKKLRQDAVMWVQAFDMK